MLKLEMLYSGLQSGCAAFILSSALSQAARYSILHQGDTLTICTLVFTWLALGILCTLPVLWASKRRVDGLLGRPGGFRLDSPSDVATCRRAAAFSFFASLSLWFAPALMQMR